MKMFFCNKQGQFTISFFESIFVAVSLPFFKEQKLIDKKVAEGSINQLKQNEDFINSNQGNVASKQNVGTRIKKAIEIINFE